MLEYAVVCVTARKVCILMLWHSDDAHIVSYPTAAARYVKHADRCVRNVYVDSGALSCSILSIAGYAVKYIAFVLLLSLSLSSAYED